MNNIMEAINKLISFLTGNKDLNKISAAGGSKLYDDTTVYTGLNVKSIYVRENTIIDTLSGIGFNTTTGVVETKNFLNEFNISGKTLIAGDLLIAPNGWFITNITLNSGTTGSIIVYS